MNCTDAMCKEATWELKIDSNLTSNIRDVFINQVKAEQNRAFEYALRNVAVPPIKGEITRGKVKWRGIRIKHKNKPLMSATWLEQRGVRISAIIELEGIIPVR